MHLYMCSRSFGSKLKEMAWAVRKMKELNVYGERETGRVFSVGGLCIFDDLRPAPNPL